MQEKVPELYQTNSFSHRPAFNNAEFVPQSFNSSSTSPSQIQSPPLWLKQKPYLLRVQHKPANSQQQPTIDTDPFNFSGKKLFAE